MLQPEGSQIPKTEPPRLSEDYKHADAFKPWFFESAGNLTRGIK